MQSLDPKPRPAKKRRVQIAGPPDPDPTPPPKSAKGKGKAAAPTSPTKGKGKAAAPTPPPKSKAAAPRLPRTFKVVAGSYEKLLYGLEGTLAPPAAPGAPPRVALTPLFLFPAHASCVKAVAASPAGGKWLASGAADEIVKVWDLRRRRELGGLVHHEGSITHLAWASRSHLLSASEDGTLALFRARDWAVLRTLRGHRGPVAAVAVHPSGKLALSVGKDRTLRMWDLLRGRGAASTKLGKEGESVCWAPSGALFAVQAHATVDVFSTKMALLYTITHPARVHAVRFFRRPGAAPDFLLVAAEDKQVAIYELPADPAHAPHVIAALVGHTNRVKALDTLTVAGPAALACTASSDGLIRVFSLDDALARGQAAHAAERPVIVESIAEYDTKGSRLTCLTMADGEAVDVPAGGKRKRRGDEAGEDEEEQSGAEGADGSE